MPTLRRAGITGTGSSLPEGVITNADLEKTVNTSDEWITSRTGIRERRQAKPEEALSDFAIPAARQALERSGTDAADIDLIMMATVSPDMQLPSTASVIQAALGAKKAAAFDLQAACSGFVYASNIAQQFIENGRYEKVLVIGGEILTKFVNYNDRTTCIIFGDGSGAAVYENTGPDRGILASAMYNDGDLADYLSIPAGGSRNPASHDTVDKDMHYIRMRGNETFKIAIRRMTEVSLEVIERAGLTAGDINLFIPHQANQRISDSVAKRLDLPAERVFGNIARIGNTSAASIPVALHEAVQRGLIKQDDLVLLTAFGGGLTWGSLLLRWAI